MVYPAVSCCMPTYGKPVEVLNESVRCFLDQDWPGDKELVIYNDYGAAEFVFDHPQVRIVNAARREPNLGLKYNRTVSFARHDFVLLWDDDDIYLPHRISYSMDRLRNGAFRSSRNAVLYADREYLEPMVSYFPATVCIRKDVYFEIGGFEETEAAPDVRFVNRVDKLTGGPTVLPLEEIFYIYRWHTSGHYHHSAVAGQAASVDDVAGAIDARIPKTLAGRWVIEPTYYRDYADLPIIPV